MTLIPGFYRTDRSSSSCQEPRPLPYPSRRQGDSSWGFSSRGKVGSLSALKVVSTNHRVSLSYTDAHDEIVQAVEGWRKRTSRLRIKLVFHVPDIGVVILDQAFLGMALGQRIIALSQDGAADRQGDRHPIHLIVGEALESVDDVPVADREGALGILCDETHAFSAVEGDRSLMAGKGLHLGYRRQERQDPTTPGTSGDVSLQASHTRWNGIREKFAEATYRVDQDLGWELRVGQGVILNRQLCVGGVDEDIHGYVGAAAFLNGFAFEAPAQSWVKKEGELAARYVRWQWAGNSGLGRRSS
jgi:hypothetical protein